MLILLILSGFMQSVRTQSAVRGDEKIRMVFPVANCHLVRKC